MTDINAIRSEFEAARAAIDAMPNEGSILFNPATGLAISIPDGEDGHIAGIQFAHIFPIQIGTMGVIHPMALIANIATGRVGYFRSMRSESLNASRQTRLMRRSLHSI